MALAAGLRPSASIPFAAVRAKVRNPRTNEPKTTSAATIYLKIGDGELFVGKTAIFKISVKVPAKVGLEL